jgi:hypothetical protein
MPTISCSECTQPMRDDMEKCPHCFRPGLFPNINAAKRQEERDALDQRYQEAYQTAKANGMESKLRKYEAAASKSEAVISRSFSEIQRLSYSEDEVYATFYQRVEAGLRLAGGDSWDRLRSVADTILFGGENKRHVRFASLTLDEQGLPHYGDGSLLVREEMIEHRATVFEENSVLFMSRHNITAQADYQLPLGLKALWSDRGKLAAAKTGGEAFELQKGGSAKILQRPGLDPKQDVFLEVHIWGSLTIRSIRCVSVKAWKSGQPSAAEIQVVQEKLLQYDVGLELLTNP